MKIKRINENKEKYMNLLLEADPDENVIKGYINKSDMYVVIEDNKAVCAIVIAEVNSDECELKNIATLMEYRGKGYAKKLIKYVFKEYSGNWDGSLFHFQRLVTMDILEENNLLWKK